MADRKRSAISDSLGITLMETVIALAMFSSAGTAILLGVGAAHTSSDRVSASAVAENLARNQMEYVLSQTYVVAPGNYSSVAHDGYSGSIEKVVVTVTRDGQSILDMESLRSVPGTCSSTGSGRNRHGLGGVRFSQERLKRLIRLQTSRCPSLLRR